MHLDEGQLRALLDDELDVQAEARRHLTSCRACTDRLERVEARRRTVASALAALDTAAPSADAREAIRKRAGLEPRVTGAEAGVSPARLSFAKAAMIVLFLGAGGAAAALPGSPIRAWLSVRTDATSSDAVESQLAQPVEPAGVRLDVGRGSLVVSLEEVRIGTVIVARWVDGTRASALAGSDARFRTSEGRIVVSEVADSIRLELPRAASDVAVEVDGRMYLRRVSGRIEVTGTVLAESPDEIRLRVQ
jgi:hypothetical protein